MCWAGKVALAIVLLLGSLGIAGALYQQIETWRDARRSPEPGRLVNAGGLRLQINCTGTGRPTVVLDSGLGDLLPEWEGVQAGVADLVRVCSYDRAGYGDSDAGPMPRTSARIATKLHTALQGSGEQPPYILVGHSFGAYECPRIRGKTPKRGSRNRPRRLAAGRSIQDASRPAERPEAIIAAVREICVAVAAH